MQPQVNLFNNKPTARQINVSNSPKKAGNCDIDSVPYLKELKLNIIDKKQPIQFSPNITEQIHRWAPYVQGFSASFVQSIFDSYKDDYKNPVVLDPFSGCGTVEVQAKLNGYESYGTELNPLLHFIASTKLNSWDVSPDALLKVYNNMSKNKAIGAPLFLKSVRHFNPEVLRNLEIIKAAIESIRTDSKEKTKIKNLLRLAFSTILVECSNLKRSPCLGYVKAKKVAPTIPFVLMSQKVHTIAEDLNYIQNEVEQFTNCKSHVYLADAMRFSHSNYYDLVITSPPYMNGMDYVMNYKIEMGWLGFAGNQKELKKVKEEMVVCDNVSKRLIRNFKPEYTNMWIKEIKAGIDKNILRRGSYRRLDMSGIVHKYFDDMYKIMKNVVKVLKRKGRFILVVGDSLIADVYIPTDLLIAKIGQDLGLAIEKVEKARDRRSGQIRSYRLRETIVTLVKDGR